MNARLKNWLRRKTLLGIRKLRKLERRLINLDTTDPNYSSLSPIGNSSENQKYAEALDWALKNRREKDIKNIALTGPYGSGKSTILKTYRNQYQGKDLKFLFISLATFKEEDPEIAKPLELKTDDGSLPPSPEKNQLLRLIETSILQQIFYHENDNKIPDSRFKKIRSFGFWALLGYTVLYSLFLLSLYLYLDPSFLKRVFKDWTIEDRTAGLLHYGSALVVATGLFGIIFNSIRILRSVTLQKLNFQNAEIGIGVNQNKSILNHHIDEILYFFSVRPYNVVIIEDLDRFKQTEIFTKLREINLLLNNSNKTRRKDIVFIYAVRDELFTDKERTKFFDFIIPVIPVINSSNSAKILMAKRSEYNYSLSDSVIEDLAYYIDDMRLLHNIANEFYLHKELLDANLSPDKLFAMITYKNKYPQQFVELSNNAGKVYELIYSKNAEIGIRTTYLQQQIKEALAEIKRLEELSLTSLEDLRRIYLAKLYPKLKQFKDFLFEGTVIETDKMVAVDNFEHLVQDRLEYEYYFYNSRAYRQDTATKPIETKFSDLEKLVDKRPYQQRATEIEDFHDNKAQSLREKIQQIEGEIENLRNEPVASILQQNAVEVQPGQEIELTDILVRNGYIAEDYPDYISLFHDGDISRTDYQFLLLLKNGTAPRMDYKLQKTARVVQKINLLHFQSALVLNFDLLDELLKEPGSYPEALKRIIKVLQNETHISTRFLVAYMERTAYLKALLTKLANGWDNVWNFFQSYSGYDDQQKRQFLSRLIANLDNKVIKKISKAHDMTRMIAQDSQFPQIIPDQHKIRELLKTLEVKFESLDLESINQETLKHIFESDLYQLNPEMVKAMMKKFGKYDQHTFENSNYSAIQSSESPSLIAYIERSTGQYVESVFLKLEKNTKDAESKILALLNSELVALGYKQKIIERMDILVTDMTKIKQSEVGTLLLVHSKIEAGWNNIRIDFLNSQREISKEAIEYLGRGNHSEIYGKMKIPNEGEHKVDYGTLSRKLAEVTKFKDKDFDHITRALTVWFADLELSTHTYKQIEILVRNQVIMPKKETFDWLKANYPPLHITQLETSEYTMAKLLETLELEGGDIEKILGSGKISLKVKIDMIDQVDENLLVSNPDSLSHLVRLLDENPAVSVSNHLLDAALLEPKAPFVERIRGLLTRKQTDSDFMVLFISSLPGDYQKINDRSKRPTFAINDLNREFLQLVQDLGLISSFPKHKNEFKVYHKTK